MTSNSTTPCLPQSETETAVHLFEAPIGNTDSIPIEVIASRKLFVEAFRELHKSRCQGDHCPVFAARFLLHLAELSHRMVSSWATSRNGFTPLHGSSSASAARRPCQPNVRGDSQEHARRRSARSEIQH